MKVKLLQRAVLRESISHIEDLPLRQFIRTVETLKDKVVTEKLDGANLWFGLDDRGLYTSREGKSTKQGRFYRIDDYPVIAAYNGFRGAHLAIEKVESVIRKYLKEGDTVEIEVLFGRQPNTVTYGVEDKNFIVFIRGVNGTSNERVINLSNALNKKSVTVESAVVTSPDGNTVEINDEKMVWEFTKVVPIEPTGINTKEAMAILAKLREFAAQPSKRFPEITNGDLAEVNLTSIPKDDRDLARSERDRINDEIMTKFKEPIKELLLHHFVRKIKPMLQSNELDPSEDVGVEGVVIRDPVTGSQTKIVDRDVFTAINSFNSAVRASITGLIRTTDQEAPVESRGGVFGQARIKIADLLGVRELALSSSATKHIRKFKKSDVRSTAIEIAKSLNIKSLPALRTKISTILKSSINEIDSILNEFKKESGTFKLELKTGKEIGLSPEVMKRTLTAFAETKKEINDIANKVLASRTPADLVLALYGRTIDSLFRGDSTVKEGYTLIKSIKEEDGGAGGDAGGEGGASAAVSSTTAGAIAPPEKRLFKDSKVLIKRKRNFTKPLKFPAPNASGKFNLLRSVNEDWAHLSDMEFATDVDDKVQSENDVEFNQLRNNVNIGDNVTQMDVDRYLDKAHELNDEVDTVLYGFEDSDGKIIKVYVNASHADQFERGAAELLGQEQDIQDVIETLAQNFDIVDVEWPEDMTASGDSDSMDDGEVEVDDDLDGEEPEIDFEVFDDEESGDEEPSDEVDDESVGDEETPDDVSDEDVESSEDSDEEPSDEESSDEDSTDEDDEEDDVERDDFGQVVGKKKKKKDETVTTEESYEIPIIKSLTEADGEKVTVNNPTVQVIANMLVSLGFDLTSTRSFSQQAKTLQARNTAEWMAGKNTAVAARMKQAWESLGKALNLLPNPQNEEQVEQKPKFSLLSSVIIEANEGEWSIGDLKDLGGIQLTTLGMRIRMDLDEAEKLQLALESGKNVSVLGKNNKRYIFEKDEDGYMVSAEDKPSVLRPMPTEEVDKILHILAEE